MSINRFMYTPDDAVDVMPTGGTQTEQDPRARVRSALGAAGYALTDADIDRIIAAAATQP